MENVVCGTTVGRSLCIFNSEGVELYDYYFQTHGVKSMTFYDCKINQLNIDKDNL